MEAVSKPPKVALYARVSTDDQCVGLQVDELQAEAARRGWDVAGTYIDEGVSGSRQRRPSFQTSVDHGEILDGHLTSRGYNREIVRPAPQDAGHKYLGIGSDGDEIED